MKKVLLIYNPVSGKQTIQYKIPEIKEILENSNCNVEIEPTKYRGYAKDIAKEAYSFGFDTVICCGGDGTLNEGMSGILESNSAHNIKLGYIPCGSTNDFGNTLLLSQDPIVQTKRFLNNEIQSLDVGLFQNERYFSYIASFGALTKASYDTPQNMKNTLGYFAYILDGIKEFMNIKPIKAKVMADGLEFSGEYIFGSVSNTKSVAGLVKLKDSFVNLHDGLFEVLLVKFPKDLIELNEIVTSATTSNFDSECFELIKAKEISFDFEEDIAWSLDGEKAEGGKHTDINILKDAVNLLV